MARTRWNDILLLAGLSVIIALLGVGGLVRGDRAKSSLEQRTLAQPPSPNWSDLVSGKTGADLETYLSDQIPGRDRFMRVHSVLGLLALGKVEMNRVVIGRHGILLADMSRRPVLDDAQIGAELDATVAQYRELDTIVRSYGGTLLVVGHPTKSSHLRSEYPEGFGFPDTYKRIAARYFVALEANGIASVDMAPVFDSHRDKKLYYRTDHHWTFEGAYLTYVALLERLGIQPMRMADLRRVTLPNRFVGSSNRKVALAFPQTERVTIATPAVPVPYSRTQDGAVSPSLFGKHPAGGAVAYDIYDQGDSAETVIDTNRPELPTLLLVGDSFTNALETLVWTSFDESRFIDLRYYTEGSLFDYVKKYKPDYVVTLVQDERYLYRKGNGLFSGPTVSADAEE